MTTRRHGRVLFGATAASALGVLIACGVNDSAVCGNNMPERGEDCDDGNKINDDQCDNTCHLPGPYQATIIWEPLLSHELPDYSETCGGVQADEIELVITGPQNFSLRMDCASGRTPIRGLRDGSYEITGRLYHVDVNTMETTPITRGLTQTSFTITTEDITTDLDFAFSDFTETYTGTFFYRTKWQGAETCAGASPPVDSVHLRLERQGQPLLAVDQNDMPVSLDGTADLACQDFTATVPQAFKQVQWGPAQITLVGLSGPDEQFRAQFDTFVGAGVSNPPLAFDVPGPDAAPAPDAGMPDAEAPDAKLPDAM